MSLGLPAVNPTTSGIGFVEYAQSAYAVAYRHAHPLMTALAAPSRCESIRTKCTECAIIFVAEIRHRNPKRSPDRSLVDISQAILNPAEIARFDKT
ncbi:MAG TPA: hypothetical protein VKA97_13910 [Pyrinomonadaceae bacterium]|nr:hypothetical protein [Pyrinomonadaceae bacterium]